MTLTVRSRFRGPATSGNGGYVAGLLAAEVGEGPVTVTLRSPPPLDVPLAVVRGDDGVSLFGGPSDGETLVGRAVPGDASLLDAVPTVPAADAMAAASAFPGFGTHPFPECFVCGPQRDPGDGMRLFPGRLGDGRTACVWEVGADLAGAAEFVWAALDCPSGWSAPIEGRPMVLGRITAQVDDVPQSGESCVVVGRFVATEGRKTWTRSTVRAADGRVLGRAHATWIAVPDAAR